MKHFPQRGQSNAQMRKKHTTHKNAQKPATYGNAASVWNSFAERTATVITTGIKAANIATQ
jgi:hypothetical protein